MRILIIDDDPTVLSVLRRHFIRRGHQITTCDSGQAGVQLIRKNTGFPFDTILCDRQMPDIDGVSVFERVVDILDGDTVWFWHTTYPEDLREHLAQEHPELHARLGIDVHVTPKLSTSKLLGAFLDEVKSLRRRTGLELD